MLIPYTAPAELYRQDMEIKKSIFITHILPVNSEEEAQQALADLRKKYKDATHNCYAWRIGTERILEKSGDDGEPQGTAGHPMLHVLQMRKLTNVLAVVTRYFGGRSHKGLQRRALRCREGGAHRHLYAVCPLYRDPPLHRGRRL